MSVFSPWYLYRPSQFARRIGEKITPPGNMDVIQLPLGLKIIADRSKCIGRSLAHNGVHELAMVETVFRLAQNSMLAVDVGANVGYVSLVLAKTIAPNGRVISFEPLPELYGLLENNVSSVNPEIQGMIDTFNVAVGSADEAVTLTIPDDFAGNDGIASAAIDVAGEKIIADCITLDKFEPLAGKQIDVMKIDVEGFEPEVLNGAMGMLGDGRVRHIVYEDHVGFDSQTSSILRGLGYSLFFISNSWFGPRLLDRNQAVDIRIDREARNYLATFDPDEAEKKLAPSGWQVLK